MKLDYLTRELIAVGANCHSCLEYRFGKAREQGIPDGEIAEAIEVGKLVRKGTQGKMDEFEDTGRLPDRNRFVMFTIPSMQLVVSVPRIVEYAKPATGG